MSEEHVFEPEPDMDPEPEAPAPDPVPVHHPVTSPEGTDPGDNVQPPPA